jgi:hypothetical protein
MSTQLIVYPQTYEGTHDSTWTATTNQFLIDGINFSTINSSPSYDSTSPTATQVITNYPPTAGSWYRWRYHDGASLPTLPNQTSNNLNIYGHFDGFSDYTLAGVYQRLSNLIVGAVYDVTIDYVERTGGSSSLITMRLIDDSSSPSTIASGSAQTGSGTTATFSFTATQTDNIFFLAVHYDLPDTTPNTVEVITNLSIVNQASGTTGVYTELNDGQVICDLYEEEDIPLTLSIDDFKNAAEQVKSYSKDFNLPATKRNNRIFNNMFEVTRADDGLVFNPYVKTRCVLKQDGFILFEGWLRMINVKDDEGEISYNVNLYSEVIAFADTLKELIFADLDFTELDHVYNKTQIKNTWTGAPTYLNPNTSGFRTTETLKYPFIDWTGNIGITTNTSTASGPTPGHPQLTSLQQAFRPCIQLKYLINKIFANTSFYWSSSFFDSADFEKLYMDFNWGSALAPNSNMGEGFGENDNTTGVTAGLTPTKLPFDIESFTNASELGFDVTTSRFTASFDNQIYNISGVFKFSYSGWTSGQLGVLGWEKFDNLGVATGYFPINNQLFSNQTSFGNIASNFNGTVVLNTGESLRPSFYKLDAGVTLTQLTTQQLSAFASNGATVITGTSDITSEILLENLRGELGQWDFLKGIMTMFNLVSMVDEDDPSNILIEPYADVFIKNTTGTNLASRSIQHDWTTKVDISQMELMPLTDLNRKTTFKFVEDDDDYAFNVYKNSTGGHLYGSLNYSAATSSYGLPTLLVGEKEIIPEPFAATVSRPLFNQFNSFVTPSIYAMTDDGTGEGFDNSPRIFYDNGQKSTGASYYIPAQNDLASENQPNFLQFSHLSTVPSISTTTRDFVFQSEQLFPGVGNAPTDNLYSTYWQPYFNELYNPDTRIMTLKVNLTPADINTFKFNDTIFIKNRIFRCNKIEYKPNSLATVEFILLP